ncbi:MAG: right-handed parallel beta-helix repeat-containing protein [Arachnia sp.]
MDDPIHQRANPSTGVTLTTPWVGEATSAAEQFGYAMDLGVAFNASTQPITGLTAVHRLWNSSTIDFVEALAGSEALKTAIREGYSDQGIRFYALANTVSGRTTPVHAYTKAGKHRLATVSAAPALVKSGWKFERVAFHVPMDTVAPAPKPTSPIPAPNPDLPPVETSVSAGSVAVGTAAYPVPSNAVYVAPGGHDNNAGTVASPFKTIQKGVATTPVGGTVVVRGGIYRETVTITRAVTVQNYPKETVWLDGSTPVSGWVKDSNAWRKSGWTSRFDSSPTYTQGAADNTAADWKFINTDYPMAAHPDQVFVNGTPLQQVKSRSLVKLGTFVLDQQTSELFIGSDPNGKTVEASTIVKAITIRGDNSTVRGIGIRRYSPSVFHIASVTIEAAGVTVENVAVANSATTGLSVQRENAKLNQVSIINSGMLGIHGRFADNLKMVKVLASGNNAERFNIAPVAGGVKLGASRGVSVVESSFSGNYGHGFWEDVSVYNSVFRQSAFNDNVGAGLFLEISAKAVVGDNTFARNRDFGIKVNNTSNVKIWNNTFIGSKRPVYIVQDARRNTNKFDQAVDPRISFPDPEMPWTLGPVVIRNNVVANASPSSDCLLCVEDYSWSMSGAQMGVSANSNVYGRSEASRPAWLSIWSRADVNRNPYVFTSLKELKAAAGQESRGREFVGSSVVDANLDLTPSLTTQAKDIAEALPADVAAAIGRPTGSRHIGRW